MTEEEIFIENLKKMKQKGKVFDPRVPFITTAEDIRNNKFHQI